MWVINKKKRERAPAARDSHGQRWRQPGTRKMSLNYFGIIFQIRIITKIALLRKQDSNLRSRGYEPREIPSSPFRGMRAVTYASPTLGRTGYSKE